MLNFDRHCHLLLYGNAFCRVQALWYMSRYWWYREICIAPFYFNNSVQNLKVALFARQSLLMRSLCLFLLFLWRSIPPAINTLTPNPGLNCSKNAQDYNNKYPSVFAHTQALEAKFGELIVLLLLVEKGGVSRKCSRSGMRIEDGSIPLELALKIEYSRSVAHQRRTLRPRGGGEGCHCECRFHVCEVMNLEKYNWLMVVVVNAKLKAREQKNEVRGMKVERK